MKKIIIIAVVMLFSISVFAGGNTGVGVGTMLFKGYKGKPFEVLAVFLNGFVCASSTFAVTSGTLGYQKGAVISRNDVESYVEENMDMLAADMSRGNGEYIDGLAELMGAEDKALFSSKMKSNFDSIYTNESVSSKEVVENIYKIHNM